MYSKANGTLISTAKELKVRDPKSLKEISSIPEIDLAELTSDGKGIVAAGGGGMGFFSLETGTMYRSILGLGVGRCVAVLMADCWRSEAKVSRSVFIKLVGNRATRRRASTSPLWSESAICNSLPTAGESSPPVGTTPFASCMFPE